MNKRYIDFVPAKKDIPEGGIAKPKSIKVTSGAVEKPVAKPDSKPDLKRDQKPDLKSVKKVTRRIPSANPLLDEEIEVEEIFAVKEAPKKAPEATMKPKFVKTEVKKRPLGVNKVTKASVAVKAGGTAVKAKGSARGIAAAKVAATAKPVKRPAPIGQRAKFINTNKIETRPLSKVAARTKPVIVPKITAEKPKAPEKIIAKPEKDSKAGLIIAIILTIILGAAAGTVAFLLLPK